MRIPLVILLFLFLTTSAFAQADSGKNHVYRSCVVLKHLSSSLKVIEDSASEMFHEDADFGYSGCIETVVDTLKKLFIKTGRVDYLVAYDNIANISDGYLAELFDNEDELLRPHFKIYVDYIYRKGKLNTGLVQFLIWDMGYDSLKDGQLKKAAYEKYFSTQEDLYKMPKAERLFIDAIIKKAGEYGGGN